MPNVYAGFVQFSQLQLTNIGSMISSVNNQGKCYWMVIDGVFNKDRIEVFYLPSYSPELNPDERLNADLKHAITTSVPKRTRQGLRKKTEEHMTMVASTPERVKSYFKDKHVSYAADSQ